ncbi:MAG: hypothetical protein KAR42_04550 [candidate division Zixibacteria bacterium]|nr:hypothetical protein [candidate division Zixibacteria bacterium]
MQEFIDFCRGPLFRLTFLVMIFGLIRILILDIWGAVEAYRNAGDKNLAWKSAFIKTIQWLFPVKHVVARRPVYSLISILFHIGLIVVPIFLLAHVQLWKTSVGIAWWTLPYDWANYLTLLTIACSVALLLGRALSKTSRTLSRKQDYLWPILLLLPFATGYICANVTVSPSMYQLVMLTHMLSAEVIFIFLPFTKIAHCVVMPLSQFVMTLAWKFPARIDKKIAATLKKEGQSV